MPWCWVFNPLGCWLVEGRSAVYHRCLSYQATYEDDEARDRDRSTEGSRRREEVARSMACVCDDLNVDAVGVGVSDICRGGQVPV